MVNLLRTMSFLHWGYSVTDHVPIKSAGRMKRALQTANYD